MPRKACGGAGGHHGIERHLQAAVGAVFVADGHRQTAGHLAMGGAFGGAGADGGQRDQIGNVLRRDRLEHFGGGGQIHFGHAQQNAAGDAEACADIEGVVQVRIVDQALPADGGARLFEVDAHQDEEPIAARGGKVRPGARRIPGRCVRRGWSMGRR